MKKENGACLLCGAELEYLPNDMKMECSLCHRIFQSAARCKTGHFICDDCHSQGGIAIIKSMCLETDLKNPVELLNRIMSHPSIHMHGPEHHVLVGSVLLTAYHHCGGKILLPDLLDLMIERGRKVPGGICGYWGSCGAGISAGIFVSLITNSTPLSTEGWGLSNQMTSRCLEEIGKIGGPRCCKRDSYLSVKTAALFIKEQFSIQMELPDSIACGFHQENQQCIGIRCPFHPRS